MEVTQNCETAVIESPGGQIVPDEQPQLGSNPGVTHSVQSEPTKNTNSASTIQLPLEPLAELQPTPRTLTRRQQEKLLEKRSNALTELLETERHYCERLDLACTLFLRGESNSNNATVSGSSCPQHQAYTRLFSSIEEILAMHQSLCDALEKRMAGSVTDETQVGPALNALVLHPNFVENYKVYCNNFSNVHGWLEALKKEHPEIREFIKKAESNSKLKGEDLESILVRVVQRIPQYNTIMAQIVEYTPQNHPDHAAVEAVVTELQQIGKEVNEFIRVNDLKKKMETIAGQLEGFEGKLASAGRYHVFDLPLSESIPSKKKPKQEAKHIFLFSDVIVLTKAKNSYDIYKVEKSMKIQFTREQGDVTCSVRLFDPDKDSTPVNSPPTTQRKISRSAPCNSAAILPNAIVLPNSDAHLSSVESQSTASNNSAASLTSQPTLAVSLQFRSHVHTLLAARQADKARLLRHFGQIVEKIQRSERFEMEEPSSITSPTALSKSVKKQQYSEPTATASDANSLPSSMKPQFLRRRKLSPNSDEKHRIVQSVAATQADHSESSIDTSNLTSSSASTNNNFSTMTFASVMSDSSADRAIVSNPMYKHQRRRSFALGSGTAKFVRCTHCMRPIEADEARQVDGLYKYHVACYRSMTACGEREAAVAMAVPVVNVLENNKRKLRESDRGDKSEKSERSERSERSEKSSVSDDDTNDLANGSTESDGKTLLRMKIRPVRKRSSSLTHFAASRGTDCLDGSLDQQDSPKQIPHHTLTSSQNGQLGLSSKQEPPLQQSPPQAHPNPRTNATLALSSDDHPTMYSLAPALFLADYEFGSQKFLITPDACLTVAQVLEKICTKFSLPTNSFHVLQSDGVVIDDLSITLDQVPAHKCYFKRKAESLPTCHHCQEKISLAELKIEEYKSFHSACLTKYLRLEKKSSGNRKRSISLGNS